MKAVHFGAGNIGRGFIGKLLADANIEVVFADVNSAIVDALNAHHQYKVQVVGEQACTETVTGVSAVNSTHDKAIVAMSEADLITTAVGPQVLIRIAGNISKALIRRHDEGSKRILNIIACENSVRASSQLKAAVFAELPEHYHRWVENHVGFVDSAVDRIVPPTPNSDDLLEVTVESFCEWIVDKTQFKGQPPVIPGMELTDNLMAFVERKLFTLNTGHAITAYLGHQSHYETIRDAILDKKIHQIVKGAMEESGAVLIQRYAFDPKKHAHYIQKILERFENPYLKDNVLRVGREPIRKLSPNDRLIKPLLGTLEYQLPNKNLTKGIAAALHYRNDQDPQAVELEEQLKKQGVAKMLEKISGLDPKSQIVAVLEQAYDK